MISYETDSSPFFVANKKYCEEIDSKLKEMKADYSGFCNSFGYEIEADIARGRLNYHLKFLKSQSNRNGVYFPVNADEYIGSEFTVTGLNPDWKASIGKNSLGRLFTSERSKEKLPPPYFALLNNSLTKKQESDLLNFINENKIALFTLRNGRIKLKIHYAISNPFDLILPLEKIIAGAA